MAKPKNLLEFLQRQKPDEMMYVGTEEGGGWIIIAPAEEVIASLDEIDETLRKRAGECIKEYQLTIDRLPAVIVNLQNNLKFHIEESDVERIADYNRKLRNQETNYVCAYNGRKKYQAMLDKWKHFGERKLIDIYKHETDSGGICVLINGTEKGDYWFRKEYEAAKNK